MQKRQSNADIVPDTVDENRRQELHYRLVAVDEEIDRVFEVERGEPEILYETAQHLLQAGGKRIRSLLVILSCEAVGGKMEHALPFAVATEFVQTASLIHDDVVDEDDIRRGVESTHKKYGNRMAIIAGDLLIAIGTKLVAKYTSPELLGVLADSGIKMCEGEASDILMYVTTPEALTEEAYFDVIKRKTVSFMRAATKMGGMVGSATVEQLEQLDAFGEQMGFAFQIRDDILDVIAGTRTTGKSALSDLKGTKANYVLIYALTKSSESDVKKCNSFLKQGEIAFALELIKRTDAVNHASEVAQEYAERAKSLIRNKGFLNEDLLILLVDHAGDREY